MNIKKGDNIKIIAGKDRGKTGKVLRVFPERNRIAVEGINLYKKHSKPKRQGEKGEVVEIMRPFHISNAQIICSSCKQPTRVGNRFEGTVKVRYCKKCELAI
jgi:large subunit ribosomal protein L24